MFLSLELTLLSFLANVLSIAPSLLVALQHYIWVTTVGLFDWRRDSYENKHTHVAPSDLQSSTGLWEPLSIITWRQEDGARWGQQVLIAYFLKLEKQRVVSAKRHPPTWSAAGLNCLLRCTAGIMQINMPFGNLWNIRVGVLRLRAQCICHMLVWCFNKCKSQFIKMSSTETPLFLKKYFYQSWSLD